MVPKSIYELFEYKEIPNTRFIRTPYKLKYNPINNTIRNTSLYKGLFLYNKIPEVIKSMNVKKFNIALKMHIVEKLPFDRINTYKDFI